MKWKNIVVVQKVLGYRGDMIITWNNGVIETYNRNYYKIFERG